VLSLLCNISYVFILLSLNLQLQKIRNPRWPVVITGVIPSKTSTHNYIGKFVDEKEEENRGQGKVFVPKPNEYLKGFDKVTGHLLEHAPHVRGISTVTLEQDAILIPVEVKGPLFNYKSTRSFALFNTYCQKKPNVGFFWQYVLNAW